MNVNLPWNPADGNSELVLDLAAPASSISVRIAGIVAASWPNPGGRALISLIGLRIPPAGPQVKPVLVAGLQVNCLHGKSVVDLNGSDAKGREGDWRPGQRFDVTLAIRRASGTATLDDVPLTYGAVTLPPPGTPLRLRIGQTGIADGAYYPPLGWTFTAISVLVDGVEQIVSSAAHGESPKPPPTVASVPAPPPSPAPPSVTPPPPSVVAPPHTAQTGPDAAGIAAAIDTIVSAYGKDGILAILQGLAPHLGEPWAELAPILAGGKLDVAAMAFLASKVPSPWNVVLPILLAPYLGSA